MPQTNEETILKKILYSYFYTLGVSGQGGIDGLDIIIGIVLFPLRFPIHLIWYYLEGHEIEWF